MIVFRKAILPQGFKANGVACGIKKSGKLDLALFYSLKPAKCACLFTTNKVQSAPIRLNKQYLKRTKLFRAIIVNSGNANAFTGVLGLKDARESSECIARVLGINKERVLVNSTGIIQKRLPIDKIKSAACELVRGLSVKGIDKAKRAIFTTDTFVKEISIKVDIGNKPVTICGVAKGAGMISPDMATLLAFIFTDADISQNALNKALKAACEGSFNSITVDGCMSTNDSLIILANGASKNRTITEGRDYNIFLKGLNLVCLELAKMVVRDGEGATKFIEITVDKAKSVEEAKRAALFIANSNLFKTAVYGQNPNFGRIASAVGASGIDIDENKLRVKVSSLRAKEIKVHVSINKGNAKAVVYTSDLTPEYIKINAEYN